MGAFGLALIIPWFFMKETKRWQLQRDELKIDSLKTKFIETIKKFSKRDWLFVILTGSIYVCWNIAFRMATTTIETFYVDLTPYGGNFQTILIFAGLATILGALTIGIVMDKFGRMIAFIFSSVGATAAYLGLAFHGHPVFMVFAYYFMACFLGFLLVYIPEMFSTEKRGTATGLSLTLSRIGYVIGPIIASAMLSDIPTGREFMFLFLVAGLIALVPMLSLLFNKYEPKGKTLEKIQEEVN
jgi:MFS family permease